MAPLDGCKARRAPLTRLAAPPLERSRMAEKRAVVRALVASQARVLAACAEQDSAQSGRLAPELFCDLLHAAGVQARIMFFLRNRVFSMVLSKLLLAL